MKSINLKSVFQILTVLVLAVFLLFAVFSGLKKGKELAASELLFANFTEAQKALSFFNLDQDRPPFASEFADKKIMLNYFSGFPLPEIALGVCKESWQYKYVSTKNAELSVCLPEKVGQGVLGWNKYKFTK